MNRKKRSRSASSRNRTGSLSAGNSASAGLFSGNMAQAKRKDLQLCKQVQRTIQLTLGDFGDDVLSGLMVESVVPAPNASQLLVIVQPLMASDSTTVAETLQRLHAKVGQLRNEIARAINRKKTPQLIFQVNSTPLTSNDRATGDSGNREAAE